MDNFCNSPSFRKLLDMIEALKGMKRMDNDLYSADKSVELKAYAKNKISKVLVALNNKTHFNGLEISILSELFFTISSNSKQNLLPDADFQIFLQVTLDITDSIALAGITRAAKKNHSCKGVRLYDFIVTMSILLRGTIEEKSYLSFKILDYDHDGVIRKNQELINLIKIHLLFQLHQQIQK